MRRNSRIVILVILVVGILTLTSNSIAQQQPKANLFVHVGISVPLSPHGFSDYWNPGVNFGAGIEYPVNPNTFLGGNFTYSRFNFDKNSFLSDLGLRGSGIWVSGASSTILSVLANLKLISQTKESIVAPYFIMESGYFKITLESITAGFLGYTETIEGDSDTALVISLGMGLDLQLNEKSSFFIQIGYTTTIAEDPQRSYIPFKVGIIFK